MEEERKKSDAEKTLEAFGQYQELGKIAAAWSAFELNLDRIIWDIAGTPQTVGACLTAQLIGPARRFDALISLVRLFNGSEKLKSEIQSFAGRAIGVAEERNRALHDAWFVNPFTQDVARFQVTAKKELKFGLVHVTKDSLAALTSKIDKLSWDIHELGKTIKAELGPALTNPPEWPVSLTIPD